jgi:transcription elongation factor Elf1
MAPMEYHATKREAAERTFECERCGARGIVVVPAVGSSGWHRDSVFKTRDAQDVALEAAGEDLMLDAHRVLGMVKCPTCGRRSARAVRWACMRIGAWVVLAVGLAVLSGGEAGNLLLAALGCGGIAIYFAWRELSRAHRAGRARFTSVTPGTPPPEKAPREKAPKVPKARAIAAPPRAAPPAPASPAPPPVAPPAPEPSPSPDGAPRFLRD